MGDLVEPRLHGDGVLELMLNRPEKRNALSIPLLEELEERLSQVKQRVLILRGKGVAFCAGLDLEEARDETTSERSSELLMRVFKALIELPAIVICAAQGVIMAGGAGLLAAADLAIVTRDLRLGFPETRRGLVPALVFALLKSKMNRRPLSEFFLLGTPISATRALEVGLVHRVVEIPRLLETAREWAEEILKGAPQAVIQTKALLNGGDDLELALKHHREVRGGKEAKEGIAAFLEKRTPNW